MSTRTRYLAALLAAVLLAWPARPAAARQPAQAPAAPAARAVQTQDVAALEAEIARLQHELDALRRRRAALPVDLAAEQSVKPGINDAWKGDKLEPLLERLETESREIYTQRAALAAVVGPLQGMEIADVGAGSGFMAEEFARIVGAEGTVYAVDINPHMLKLVGERAAAKGIDNIETVVCSEKSVDLAAGSVDLVFVCDTYHHFEYPRNTLRSIREALRAGGQMVVVDFHRIPGKSRDWIFDHVRAGEEDFTREIEEAGFELVNTHYPPFFTENYILRFRKADGAP